MANSVDSAVKGGEYKDIPVSVCVPTYNNGCYIGKTIASIIAQTHSNIEIIICDNASSDNTKQVVESFGDPRIKYYCNPQNIGANLNFRKAVDLASYEYVALYHSDDIYEPKIVEKELRILLGDPEAAAVFTLDKLIDKDDKPLGEGVNLPRQLVSQKTYSFRDLYLALLGKSGGFLICPTCMMKKTITAELKVFDNWEVYGDWIGGAGDLFMYFKLAQKYRIAVIQERLIKRRISLGQGSSQYEETRISRANHFMLMDNFMNDALALGPIAPDLLDQYDYNKFWDDVKIARNMTNQGMAEEAKKLLLSTFSRKVFFESFRDFKNLTKLFIYTALTLSLFAGLGKAVIKILRFKK